MQVCTWAVLGLSPLEDIPCSVCAYGLGIQLKAARSDENLVTVRGTRIQEGDTISCTEGCKDSLEGQGT